jgi:hypothetical protein
VLFELAHELLPYALALYLFDGLVRVRESERLLASSWGGRFGWRGPGWHPAGLLPTSEVFVVGPADGGASPEGASAATTPTAASAGPVPANLADTLAAIRALRATHARHTPALAALGFALLAVVFGALPWTVYLGPRDGSRATAVVLVAAFLWAAIVAVAAHSLRTAGLRAGAILSAVSPALFFPPAAAHALAFIRRDAFRAYPPLAVAAALLPEADFRRLARRELHSASGDRASLLALMGAMGVSEHATACVRHDAAAALFCPLCETEYRAGFSTCADCDVTLVPLREADLAS